MQSRNTWYLIPIIILLAFLTHPGESNEAQAILGAVMAGGLLLNGISQIGSGKRARKQANSQMNSAISKADEYTKRKKKEYAPIWEQMKDTNNQFASLASGINAERAKTYTDTAEGRSFLSTISDQGREGRKGAMNSANLAGMSPEAMLAMINNVNTNGSRNLRDLAGQADNRRMNLRSQYMGALGNLGQGVNNLFQSQYGIDRDSLSSLMGASISSQNSAYNRQANNQQMIGQGIGSMINLGGQAGWFDGGS